MSDIKIEQDDILYSPELVQQQRDGVYLLIDPNSPNWVSVNRLGSEVIRSCDGRHSLKEISENIEGGLGIGVGDVVDFLKQAAETGFVSTCPDLLPAYPGRAQTIAPEALEELWINTNNSCTLHCVHCLVDGGTEPVTPLTEAEIKKVVDEAIALGASRVYFTGGEPFLRKDLLSLVQYITKRVQLVILTSGVLITEEKAFELKKVANNDLLIQVSLDGPDAKTNDSIRGEGNFDLAVKGIRSLIKAGFSPIITTTLTRLNYMKASETTLFLASLGVKDHHILWLHGRGKMRDNATGLLVTGTEVARVMEELKNTTDDLDIVVDNLVSLTARVRGKRGRKNDLCNSGYGILSVNADGHVYPCAALAGAAGFDCGSIKEQNLRDIWLESSTLKWIRDNSVQKRVGCSSCFLKYFCGGGCFAQSYFDYELNTGEGCIMAPDPYCEAYKTQLMDAMWHLATPASNEEIENHPVLYRQMENTLPGCAIGSNKVLNAAFDVGTYHCSCVLAMDTK